MLGLVPPGGGGDPDGDDDNEDEGEVSEENDEENAEEEEEQHDKEKPVEDDLASSEKVSLSFSQPFLFCHTGLLRKAKLTQRQILQRRAARRKQPNHPVAMVVMTGTIRAKAPTLQT